MSKKLSSKFDPVSMVLADLRARGITVPSPEEERALFTKIEDAEEGSLDYISLINEAVERNYFFAVSMAQKYQGCGLDVEDIVSAACVGLHLAARTFDLSRGARFVTHASWKIRSKITLEIRNYSKTIRMPTYVHNDLSKIQSACVLLEGEGHSHPSVQQLSDLTGIALHRVENALAAKAGLFVASVDHAGFDGTHYDCESDAVGPVEDAMQKDTLKKALALLSDFPEEERAIVEMYLGLNGCENPRTFKEIGHHFGVASTTVSTYYKVIVGELRNSLDL